MSTQKINAFGKTDVGLMRTINQDSIFLSTESIGKLPNLFIVADGMGGHKAGDVASRQAIELFVKYVLGTHMSDPANILDSGIISINKDIYDMAMSNRDYNGMGTTFVACTIVGNHVYIANVGDSRLYLVGRDIRQITRDHSLVEEMVLRGQIDKEEARTHVNKNIITRAIGVLDDVSPELFSVDLTESSILLLCSDGLTNMVSDQEILEIIKSEDNIKGQVEELVRKANENGGKDNITAMIINPL